MITFVKSTFLKTEKIFSRIYMSRLEMLLVEGEEFVKSISPYKSGEVIAWFTNKRVIFTSSAIEFCVPGKVNEVEFLPYRSAKRYAFLEGNNGKEFKVDIFLADELDVSFFMSDMGDAMEILKLLGEKCI